MNCLLWIGDEKRRGEDNTVRYGYGTVFHCFVQRAPSGRLSARPRSERPKLVLDKLDYTLPYEVPPIASG